MLFFPLGNDVLFDKAYMCRQLSWIFSFAIARDAVFSYLFVGQFCSIKLDTSLHVGRCHNAAIFLAFCAITGKELLDADSTGAFAQLQAPRLTVRDPGVLAKSQSTDVMKGISSVS